MNASQNLFNMDLYRLRRNRAAAHFHDYNFLKLLAAERIIDRLADINRTFPLALDLGCHTGEVEQLLKGSNKITTLISCDSAEAMTVRAAETCSAPALTCAPDVLPFAPNTFDLILSALSLHHINDLVGTLIQVQQLLKPDGLFLAILPGANTLIELRESFAIASASMEDGISPRIAPFVEIRDAGGLLQRAGFALPVADTECVTVTYAGVLQLMKDLKGMGENNTIYTQRKSFTAPDVMMAMSMAYAEEYMDEETERIPATFELITLTGWKPDASQQQPAKRGSGQVNLGEALS